MDYSSALNGRNILITGGTGSFGHQMIRELMVYKPKVVRIFSRDEDKQHTMQEELSKEPILKRL
jgi:UDP-N-acetylglucosamine 4,6-dehydratase/5-epimerase